jgi:hypothetical protein
MLASVPILARLEHRLIEEAVRPVESLQERLDPPAARDRLRTHDPEELPGAQRRGIKRPLS